MKPPRSPADFYERLLKATIKQAVDVSEIDNNGFFEKSKLTVKVFDMSEERRIRDSKMMELGDMSRLTDREFTELWLRRAGWAATGRAYRRLLDEVLSRSRGRVGVRRDLSGFVIRSRMERLDSWLGKYKWWRRRVGGVWHLIIFDIPGVAGTGIWRRGSHIQTWPEVVMDREDYRTPPATVAQLIGHVPEAGDE